MIDHLVNPQIVEALGWTLLNSLWQGAIFAILLAVLLIVLRNYSAHYRYIVSVGLFCTFFLSLSASFWLHWQGANSRIETFAPHQLDQQATDVINYDENNVQKKPSHHLLNERLENNREILESNQFSWLLKFKNYYNRHLPLIVTIWFFGILFLQLRFLGQIAYLQRLKNYGTQLFPTIWTNKIIELEAKLGIKKKVNYLISIRIKSPMVIGWIKPVVLFPQQLFHNLSETEIYNVLAHELAHIKREDFIINLMQTFVCNIFFFHPGVWFMSNRIDDEREHCCDDLAIAATGRTNAYAKTLINVSELQLGLNVGMPLAMALSVKGNKRKRAGFSDRIHRLFKVNNDQSTLREGFATAFILLTAVFIGISATGNTEQNSASSTDLSNLKEEIISNKEIQNNLEFKVNGQHTSINTNAENSDILNDGKLDHHDVGHNEIGLQEQNKYLDGIQFEGSAVQLSDTSIVSVELNTIISTSTVDVHPTLNVVVNDLPVEEPETLVMPSSDQIDALVRACEEGDFESVKTLVISGVDLNGIGSEGFSPLMIAAGSEEIEIVQYLLKHGADVNQVYDGWTALIEAADEGSLKSMKQLLKAGADINYYAGWESPTALSMAASEGYLECLKLLLESGADINGIGKSIPPLHIAAEEGKRMIIEHLISEGVSINKKDKAGRTALMYAASEGKMSAVKKLIDAGADISITDFNGATARDYAVEEKQYDIRNYIENKGERESSKTQNESHFDLQNYAPVEKSQAIHQATNDGYIEKVERLVEQGTDVNTTDYEGRTPLHKAAAKGYDLDMRVLINLGADINAQDNQGRTPLIYAATNNKENATALLISQTADANITDVEGRTAFDWARNRGNKDLANFLGLITKKQPRADRKENSEQRKKKYELRVEQKIQREQQKLEKDFQKHQQKLEKEEQKLQQDIEKRENIQSELNENLYSQINKDENSWELLEAVRQGDLLKCSILLKNGQNVNATNFSGETALIIAASMNHLDIAQSLIDNGANVNRRSNSGATALHYAALENNEEFAQLLLKNNAQVDPQMQYSSTDGNKRNEPIAWKYIGATPLLVAVESGAVDVVATLLQANANSNHELTKQEYRLKRNRATYLSGMKVMGLNDDFLDDAKIKFSDYTWTPYKQALLLNNSSILDYFPK